MLSIPDDQYQRAQKSRKQNIYRQILDQQVRYKKQYQAANQQPASSHYTNIPIQQRQSLPSNNLPSRQSISPVKDDNFVRRNRYQTEPKVFEDRTEKHIKHCEQILRNLKELKEKRSQRQNRQIQKQPSKEPNKVQAPYFQNKINSKDWNYYPKNQYFSVAPNPNNANSSKSISNNRYLKPKLKSYNTIDNQQETAPRNKENPEHLPKSVRISKKITTKRQESKSRAVPGAFSDRNKSNNTDNPTSLSKKQIATQRSSGKTKKSAKRLQATQRLTQKQRELQNLKDQLSDCLVELAKFIKTKKQHEEQEQARKSQLAHQQIQVGISGIELQELDKQKEKEAKIHQLKLKALIKLRKIRDQSRDLAIKVGGKASEKELKRKHPYSKSKSRLSRQLERQLSRQNYMQKESGRTLPLNSAIKSPRSVSPIANAQRAPPDEQDNNQNEELIRSIANHLNRQQQQNEQLVQCLKELSEYLKNQNQQIQFLTKSRQRSQSPTNNQSQKAKDKISSRNSVKPSPKKIDKQVRYEQFPKITHKKKQLTQKITKEDEKQPTKEQESKLKEAFLHRLKKARMRGSLLTEKIEAHKKTNHKSAPTQEAVEQNPVPVQEKQAQIIPNSEQPNP